MTAIIAIVEDDTVYIAADTQQTCGDRAIPGSKFVERLGWVFAWAGGSGVVSWLLYDVEVELAISNDSASAAYNLAYAYKKWKDADKETRESNLLAVSPSGLAFEIFDGSICELSPGVPIAYGAPSPTLAAYEALRYRDGWRPPLEAMSEAIAAVCAISLYCGLPVETRTIKRVQQ